MEWREYVGDEITKTVDGEVLSTLLEKFGWWRAELGDTSHADAETWCHENCKSGWKNCYTNIMFYDRAEAALFKVFVT